MTWAGSPRIIFLAHRWPVDPAAAALLLSEPVEWPGGRGKISVASDDPLRSFLGAVVRPVALSAHGWMSLCEITGPGTYDVDAPAGLIRISVSGAQRPFRITAIANWYAVEDEPVEAASSAS